MGKDTDEILEKEFAKHELVYIIILTAILLIAWVISSDVINKVFETFKHNQYCYCVVGLTIIITILVMRVIGRKVSMFISNFWILQHQKKKKKY